MVVGDHGQVYARTATEKWRPVANAPIRVAGGRVLLSSASVWRGALVIGGAYLGGIGAEKELDSSDPDVVAAAALRVAHRDVACLWRLEGDRFVHLPLRLDARELTLLGARGDRLWFHTWGDVFATDDLQTFRGLGQAQGTQFQDFAQTETEDLFLLNDNTSAQRLPLQVFGESGLSEVVPPLPSDPRGNNKHSLQVVGERVYVCGGDHIWTRERGAWTRSSFEIAPVAEVAPVAKKKASRRTKRVPSRSRSKGPA